MPYKFIGKTVNYTGKTLWEILGNLKNYGVGRIVIKSHFKNYPEPSYYKIVKVQPVMAPKEQFFDRRVMVWAEHVFRGNKFPELVKMHDRTFKPKFQLIPRKEEAQYTTVQLKQEVKEIPQIHEWPPLLKIYLEREYGKRGLGKLEPLNTVLSNSRNQLAVLSGSPDQRKTITLDPPKLHSQFSVAELTEKLNELQSRAEASVTADKTP